MATVAEIIASCAALQNDAAQDVYTNAACLPYFNLALQTLQEEFELYDIPVTREVSAIIPVDADVSAIGFNTIPILPGSLVEIKQIWESPRGVNNWIPMSRRDSIPHHLENDAKISQLLLWAWIGQEIRFIPANAHNDIKLDYLRYLFNKITIADINLEIPVINAQTYMEFKTAAFCSQFIGENENRAVILEGQAAFALDRALGINIKGRQAVRTRRRPFRSSFKARSRM